MLVTGTPMDWSEYMGLFIDDPSKLDDIFASMEEEGVGDSGVYLRDVTVRSGSLVSNMAHLRVSLTSIDAFSVGTPDQP